MPASGQYLRRWQWTWRLLAVLQAIPVLPVVKSSCRQFDMPFFSSEQKAWSFRWNAPYRKGNGPPFGRSTILGKLQVCGFRPTCIRLDVEVHLLTFIERAHTRSFDCCDMHHGDGVASQNTHLSENGTYRRLVWWRLIVLDLAAGCTMQRYQILMQSSIHF